MKANILLAAAIAAFAVAPGPAAAKEVVYDGEDLQKLKCATILSMLGEAGLHFGEIGVGEYVMNTGAVISLMEGLPGTPAQKSGAMEQMAERILDRNTPETLGQEIERTLPLCDRFFR